MPKIHPFKAVRPTRDKVSLVASRSYESYTVEQREARLRDNPFSFLHIINPGFKYQKKIQGSARYDLVKNRYEEFKEDEIFIQDQTAHYYIYKIVNKEGAIFNGIVGAAQVSDYLNNAIKRHEDTLSEREEIFKEYLKTVGFNAEAVLLTYPDNTDLDTIIKKVMEHRAEYEFTTTYKDTHYLWPVNDSQNLKTISEIFDAMPNLYIADGHHRCASSALLAEGSENERMGLFMSYLIPESELKIYEFNRLVKDLNELSTEEFLIKLDAVFRIEKRNSDYYKPSKKHHFSMYLEGAFYSLYLRKDLRNFKNSLESLDTYILNERVLKPILGIKDARNDDRLDYAHGKLDMAYVRSVVDKGQYKVGFGLVPITISDMKEVANENLTMPPKSTYIEPKLRSGVTIYEF